MRGRPAMHPFCGYEMRIVGSDTPSSLSAKVYVNYPATIQIVCKTGGRSEVGVCAEFSSASVTEQHSDQKSRGCSWYCDR